MTVEQKTKKINTFEGKNSIIEIDDKLCKGCDICVEFCPKVCLKMEGNVVRVIDADLCNACMLCELRCPDFAIKIIKKEKKT